MLRLLKNNHGLAFILIILAFLGGAIWLGYFFTKLECTNYEQTTGMEVKYYFVGGCYAKTPNDGWMKTSNITVYLNEETK